jgi:hypothetical protein
MSLNEFGKGRSDVSRPAILRRVLDRVAVDFQLVGADVAGDPFELVRAGANAGEVSNRGRFRDSEGALVDASQDVAQKIGEGLRFALEKPAQTVRVEDAQRSRNVNLQGAVFRRKNERGFCKEMVLILWFTAKLFSGTSVTRHRTSA